MRATSKAILVGSLCVLVAGLALLAFMGFYNRYWADDWCYNRDFRTMGLGRTIGVYFQGGEHPPRGYSSNRYSLTLMSGLLYGLGVFGTQVLGLLVIVSWLASLWWLLAHAPGGGVRYRGLAVTLAATLLVFFNLYLSPQRFEVLYWRSGVHYSLTIIGGLLMLALIARQAGLQRGSALVGFALFILAFLVGGLSETGAVWLLVALALVWLVTWSARRSGAAWASKAWLPATGAVLGAAAATLALAVAPSNDRVVRLHAQSTGWLLVFPLAFRYALDFMLQSLKSLPLPHLVFAVAFAALAIVSADGADQQPAMPVRRLVLWLAATAVVVLVLIAAVQAPTVRFYSSPPAPRAQSIARFTMLAGMACAAWLLSRQVASRAQARWLVAAALIALVGVTLYSARLIVSTYPELAGYQQRAALWDKRDALIRAALAQGERRISIPVIDTHEIGVRDILSSVQTEGRWVTSCGTEYYGLDAVRAEQP